MARGRVTRGGIDGDLTRETLDRMAVGVGGRFEIGCPDHPDGATRAAYQDGVVRVICRACGFEAMRVKVAPEQRGGVAPELTDERPLDDDPPDPL